MGKLKEEFAEVSKHELHPEMAEKNFEIYFDEIHPSDKEISEQGSISFLYFDADDEALSIRYHLESYVEQCEAREADPRMQVKGGGNIDEGGIAMKLQGEEAWVKSRNSLPDKLSERRASRARLEEDENLFIAPAFDKLLLIAHHPFTEAPRF